MNLSVWAILWGVAATLTGGVMFGAWTGPHRSVSNLSRWAARLRIRRIPAWLSARAADRWAFRGGLFVIVLLLGAPWLVPSQRMPEVPAAVPSDVGNTDSNRGAVAPARPDEKQRPDRHIDADLKNAILLHIPKTKQVKLVVLNGDAEADQFAWEIDAFLRAEGYTVSPRALFAMAAGGTTPTGTTVYPDQGDPNVLVIRVGQNDRNPNPTAAVPDTGHSRTPGETRR
jgi:hypothetical protein